MTQHRNLGKTDLHISPIALGCMSLCSNMTYDDIPEQQAIDTVHAALDAGVNFFDTAPGYGDGESERRLGKALVGRRDRVIVANKVSQSQMAPADVLRACETSLKLLQTDYLDLYQIHWPNRAIPLEDTLGAMEKLKAQGKIRAIGVCNFGPVDLANAVEKHRIETDQLPYSLLWRAVEYDVRDMCAERQIGILCYSPLAQGLLTGRYRSADEVPEARARTRHFSKARPQARHGEDGCEAETFDAIAKIESICARVGRPMADVAIAWLLHQPAVASVLAGASRPEQIRRNIDAADLKLPNDVLTDLDAATRQVKERLGPNIDPWQGESRIR